jgi:hypothetical protein
MYIKVNDAAVEGEYVVHQETGEKKEVISVINEYADIKVEEFYPVEPGLYARKLVTWSLNDYFVLREIANLYFLGEFYNPNEISVRLGSARPNDGDEIYF